MRKLIIDTDTASDDAAALILAALDDTVEILGVTTVAGNVGIRQATQNALMTLEMCGKDVPVYVGAPDALFVERRDAACVHGEDGMGDSDLIHPKTQAQPGRAVDFILDTVQKYPDEVEIVALGPATNVALAIMTDREIMRHVKHIWSMGTSGMGVGNATPLAEFNVYGDAEAYQRMLSFSVPVTIIGFDLCTETIGLHEEQLQIMAQGTSLSKYMERATSQVRRFNRASRGKDVVDLPDAIAMGVVLWDDFVLSSVRCHASCRTARDETYGQVIFYQEGVTYEFAPEYGPVNAELILRVDEEKFLQRFLRVLLAKQNQL